MEKKWIAPEMSEMNVADTQHGGETISTFDDIYVNKDGVWEGTFNPSQFLSLVEIK